MQLSLFGHHAQLFSFWIGAMGLTGESILLIGLPVDFSKVQHCLVVELDNG